MKNVCDLQVISQAHAVVLASGTLSPIESLKAQLFPNQNVCAFSCGHVVPKENLLAIALQKGPSGEDLDFRHQKRSQPSATEQLGRLLLNFCRAVPQVTRFPGYLAASAVLLPTPFPAPRCSIACHLLYTSETDALSLAWILGVGWGWSCWHTDQG